MRLLTDAVVTHVNLAADKIRPERAGGTSDERDDPDSMSPHDVIVHLQGIRGDQVECQGDAMCKQDVRQFLSCSSLAWKFR